MKLCISSSGARRLLHAGEKRSAVGPARRFPTRTVLFLGAFVLLLLLFLRGAFLVPDFPSVCGPCLANECIVWRFFGGCDSSHELREELTRALLEGEKEDGNSETEGIESFNELVKLMTSQPQDIKTFVFRSKAVLLRMEHKVESARQQESVYWQLASHGIPKGLNCLCLKLAEEYAVNAMARSCLPQPEYVSCLVHPSYLHVVLLTDNVLAASVVISSIVQYSANPEKLVFHIVTDKKTYTPMHAWFAINPIKSAVVEVKGLHQYEWSQEVNIGIREIQEIHRLIWNHHHNNLKEDNTLQHEGEHIRWSEALSPRFLSLLNHLRIYMPELFPELNKIVFLDDDVVVQRDISSLWDLDLNGKVIGAVVDSWCGENCCPGRRYKDYLNFSYQVISTNFEDDRCAWLYGMNIFDLEAWRKKNITKIYLQWLKHSLNFGLDLMQPGALAPALLAFEGQVHPIDPSWHVAGLGHRNAEARREILEAAAVIHFSGPAKPWLDIGLPEVRRLWSMHVNFSNAFIRECRIMR